MARVWRNDPSFKGCKYLVQRRDGTVPDWPWFVLGARDPDAPAGLREYANKAEARGRDPQYVADLRAMADEWDELRKTIGEGDPDAPRHRTDDPVIIAKMPGAKGA